MEELDVKKIKGQRVKSIRDTLGMTQKEFANLLGIENTAVSKIEHGESNLTDQNINLICTPNRIKEGYTINESWLRNGGDIPMFSHTPDSPSAAPVILDDEEELIGVYRDLFPSNKKLIRDSAKIALASQKNTVEEIAPSEGGETRRLEKLG